MMPTCREHNIYLFTSDAATYILEVSLALWPSHLSKSDSTTVKPFTYLEVRLPYAPMVTCSNLTPPQISILYIWRLALWPSHLFKSDAAIQFSFYIFGGLAIWPSHLFKYDTAIFRFGLFTYSEVSSLVAKS